MQRIDFDKLYQEHAKHVYRFLLRLCGDSHLAEDLLQDTFLKAIEKVNTFDRRCEITTWLCQIAKNTYFDFLRRKGRRPEAAELSRELPSPSPSLEEIIIADETGREIRMILHNLSEPYKEVFLLRFCAELSFREIGQTFGKSEVWARVTYLRSKEMILREMQKTHLPNKQ